MKKFLTLLFAVALVCTLTVGCGGNTSDNGGENGDSTEENSEA